MRAPDLNAPRFRYKFTDILTVDLVKNFKKQNPQYAHYNNMDLVNALSKVNQAMARTVVDNREGIELPSNLGYIFIGMVLPATKKQRPNIAWRKSIELGIKVVYKNWDTDNRIGKIFYSSYGDSCRFENRQLWAFNACRPLKKNSSDSIKENWQKYSLIDPHFKIWKLFEKHKKKAIMNGIREEQLKEYNEFEIED